MIEMLKELCALTGVSGCEDEIRNHIRALAEPYADEILVDALGNLLVFKKGRVTPPQRIMLAAHMDEVGLIITEIRPDGYLSFANAGGIDRRVLMGKRVFVGPDKIPGIVGNKAFHLAGAEARKQIPKLKSMYIDIGAGNREEAAKLVTPGDNVSFAPDVAEFGNNIRAKAIDDRTGCAAMVRLLQGDLPCDCWFAFTVQEEVGCRGAGAAARYIRPDLCLILEGTTAADLPDITGADRICKVGGGVVLPFMDGGAIYDRALQSRLCALADQAGIPWQTKTRIAGGTDAQVIQRSGTGVRTAAISVAMRNIHSPACVAALSDCRDQLRLAKCFLYAAATEKL